MRTGIQKLNFNQAQYEAASQVKIIDFIISNGYKLIKEGADYRCRDYGNLVLRSGERWYSNDERQGGIGILSFLTKFEKRTLPEAVNYLAGNSLTYERETATTAAETPPEKQEFILPARNENNNRVFAYLCKTRCLDREIIANLVRQGKLYESAERHNAVFVGFDENKTPKLAIQRGTYTGAKFQGDVPGSDKRYSFIMEGKSERVLVFESPIDAVSLATIFKNQNYDNTADTYLALDGLSPLGLAHYLKNNPNGQKIKRIVFCLDNDEVGQSALKDKINGKTGEVEKQGFISIYSGQGYDVKCFTPQGKDFNDDLVSMFHKAREPTEMSCATDDLECEM
jgi:hypothetical protein